MTLRDLLFSERKLRSSGSGIEESHIWKNWEEWREGWLHLGCIVWSRDALYEWIHKTTTTTTTSFLFAAAITAISMLRYRKGLSLMSSAVAKRRPGWIQMRQMKSPMPTPASRSGSWSKNGWSFRILWLQCLLTVEPSLRQPSSITQCQSSLFSVLGFFFEFHFSVLSTPCPLCICL